MSSPAEDQSGEMFTEPGTIAPAPSCVASDVKSVPPGAIPPPSDLQATTPPTLSAPYSV
jgi:hypothetical protein